MGSGVSAGFSCLPGSSRVYPSPCAPQLAGRSEADLFCDVLHVEASLTQQLLGQRHSQAIRVVADTHADVFIKQPREVTISRSEEHTSELQSQSNLVCRLL